MKIGMRLGLSFGVVSVLIVVILLTALTNLKLMNDNVHDLTNDKFPKVLWAHEIKDGINEAARAIRNSMLVDQNDNAQIERELSRMTSIAKKIDSNLDSLTRTIQTEQGKEILKSLNDNRSAYYEKRKQVLDNIKLGQREQAIRSLLTEVRDAQRAYFGSCDELVTYQIELFKKADLDTSEAYNNAFMLILIIGIAAILFAIVISILIINSIVKPVSEVVNAANSISQGNMNIKLETSRTDETGILIGAMRKMADSINLLVSDANDLSKAAVQGRLDKRADASRHNGEFKAIIEGVNGTLDSVIGPLNVAAEYVDRISKGDIPPKISDEYRGDFNEIKNNLNQLIDIQDNLIIELDNIITAVTNGRLDKRAKSEMFVGGWGEILKGLNSLVDAFVSPINLTAEYVDRISKGDIPPKITDDYKGDFNEIKNNLNQCIEAVGLLVADTRTLAEAGKSGMLRKRADAEKHNGDFRKVVDGVNKTLDSIVNMIDSLPMPAFIINNDFDIVFMNNTGAKLGGKIGRELEGQKCNEFFKTPHCKTGDCGCYKSMKDIIETVQETQAIVAGKQMEIKYSAIPIIDDNGTAIGAFEVIVDQTEIKNVQKEVEKKAIDMEEKAFWYEQILDSIPSPISVTDMDMNWTFINKAAEGVAGAKRADVVGKHCSNWGADICNTENCGVHGLRHGKPTTYFNQPGLDMDFKVDAAYITNQKGEKIGHIEVVTDVTESAVKSRYLNNEIDRLAKNLQRISQGDLNIDTSVAHYDKYTKDEHDEFVKINENLVLAKNSIDRLITDAEKLAGAAIEGRLDTRADASRHNGGYRKVIEGVNRTLDNVIAPLNVAAEYVDRISKGDIPPVIRDEYRGDFNEIKNNINRLIENLNVFIDSIQDVYAQHQVGEIEAWIAADLFQGCFREMSESVNNLGKHHVDAVLEILDVVKAYGEGNFNPVIRRFAGKQAIAHEIIDSVRDNLMGINSEVGALIESASEGRLTARASADMFSGGWRELVAGVNSILDSVIEPLTEAAETLETMSSGDLKARMQGFYKGDLEQFKNSINTLGDSLSYAIGQVLTNVQASAASAMEISSVAESLAAAAQEQSAQADEVATAVEEMSRTVTENAMSAGKTAIEAERNGKVARDGGKVVEQTVSKMRDIATVVKNSAESIIKLGESSKQIGEIISVIDDIADQTNLLALNAAIEAARAGEQGRGFAVVADEVRKLAERTTEATKQIAKMIKGIQEETQQAVTAMNRGNEEVKSGIELADKAGSSLQEIVVSSTDVQDMINQIAAASEEQSSTSEEISKNVMSISRVTGESAKRIEEIAHSAEDLSKLTDHLSELMSQFKISDDVDFNTDRTVKRQISGKKGYKNLPASTY